MKKILHKLFLKLAERTEDKPKTWKVEEGHVIVPAFISEGVQYYMMKDSFNTYCMRALEALDVYEQWNMRCSREHLMAFINALDAVISKPTIRIEDIVKLKINMAERLNYALPSKEIIYRFAAVAFFDANESPYTYDDAYGKQKIEKWKKAMDIESFFLTVPIGTMMPLPDISQIDLEPYLKVLEMVEEKEKELISELQSS